MYIPREQHSFRPKNGISSPKTDLQKKKKKYVIQNCFVFEINSPRSAVHISGSSSFELSAARLVLSPVKFTRRITQVGDHNRSHEPTNSRGSIHLQADRRGSDRSGNEDGIPSPFDPLYKSHARLPAPRRIHFDKNLSLVSPRRFALVAVGLFARAHLSRGFAPPRLLFRTRAKRHTRSPAPRKTNL